MRIVMILLGLAIGSFVMSGGDAAAAPEGKRVMLLGTSNANPYIGAWTATFTKFATAPA